MAKNQTSFKKGKTGNNQGRPAGASNNVKDWWDDFFQQDRAKIQEDWDKISPSLRMNLRAKYWDYQMPRLRSDFLEVDFDGLSDKQYGQMMSEIFLKMAENEEARIKRDSEGNE